MKLPQLQMHSVSGQIGIRSEAGQFEIRQAPATMDIKTTPPVIDVKTEQPVVIIDLSKMWDALTGGKPVGFWNRIYSQNGHYVVDAIRRTVEEYNRIGNILAEGNPIAEIARENMAKQQSPIQVYGPASYHNISFEANITKPEINITPGRTEVEVQTNKPDIQFHRGGVSIYMERYPSLTITSPQIDLAI